MMLDHEALLRILPHRSPMLLLDRVVELDPGERAVGLLEITAQHCEGHFPGAPVFPGVHILEAMAQVAAVTQLVVHEDAQGQPVYLVGADKLRFRRPVRPGDTLRIEVVLESVRFLLYTFLAQAWVDDVRVADGRLLAAAAPESERD